MPRYFGQKGQNKQTWQFRKTHPQLRVLQKEAKTHMSFFDQLDQCLQQQQQRNQRALEGTPSPSWEPTDPSIATQASTSKTTVNKQPDLITVEPRTKTAKHTFVRKYPKTVMAQPPEGEQEIYPTLEEIISDRLYKSSASGSHQGRSQSLAHQGISKATPCWTDQGDSTDI